MESKKWFDRKFDLAFGTDRYAAIYLQLKQAPERLRAALTGVSEERLCHQPGGGWSIKEHTGHLSLMEPIWRIRFHDIQVRKPVLSPADLTNAATTEANFNARRFSDLLEQFIAERNRTLTLLDSLDVSDTSRTSMHPRLAQPMRMIDLAYFVAEHDDHHINRAREIALG